MISETHPKEHKLQSASVVSELGLTPHILVVDDDSATLEVISQYLISEGLRVTTFCNGELLLQQLETEQQADLVLLDITLPDSDGYVVCERLRESFNAAELPVIMLTSIAWRKDWINCINCGANDYLQKPVAGEELLARVVTQLRVRGAHQAALENQQLKMEIVRRRQTEWDLQLIRRRLGAMLDSVPESVLAISEGGELCFCNQAFEQLTGFTVEQIQGRAMEILFPAESQGRLHNWLEGLSNSGELEPCSMELIYANHSQHYNDIQAYQLELEDELLLMLVVRAIGATADQVPAFIVELVNRNRNRLRAVEESLCFFTPELMAEHPELIDDLHAIDTALKQLTRWLDADQDHDDIRSLLVNVMNLVVDYWLDCALGSKGDLARQSGLWKVYTNENGWDRTQTLDRYLCLETLPKYPRRKQVIRTAEFVLTCGRQDSAKRQHLERALMHLYAGARKP